ncbi:tRNA dihydrouridine synthase DusB [Helicobacter sp. CLO-3]|uniref:tRNA dihydrouridine synthase n=1 Tax=unclassified Helicobacter TaxID=2593540 RepID=UPI000804C993|nr:MULTISPECIES: tRNA-dihydrouridine synthase [unclassified Helicobacter]OBV28449.1 tRNA-dihydrouridine synthase [Helicobacter sp. CLO-3]OHU82629.1 tRNA dihydrouridine synthase DusB [Helicobacter sp. CLO-3]
MDFATARELLFLAPLAGYTDLPFRSVVKRFGVDVTVSEMISSHALAFASAKTLKMAEKSPLETPYSVQIAGSKPEVIKRAIEILNQKEGIDILDFNCGCPAPKVANHGNGSGLLQNLTHLVSMLKLIRETSTTRHTSVKVRLGFDKKIPLEIAHALNDAPVDFVVVHGRTRSDGYKKERIDYDAIAAMRQILRHPVIANGEIDSARKAHEVMERTGANGVMIGRAALSAPWIFWQIRHRSDELPNLIKKELVLEHFDAMVGFYGERGVVMFRKNLHAYAKGHEGASAFRNVVNTITSPKEMRERIEAFFDDSFVAWASEPIVELNKKSV